MGTAPTSATKYAITSLSANFFAKETEQIDYLFVFDDDSVGDDNGALTSADGVVREFDATGGSDAGRKRGAASRAQTRQHH